MSIPPLLGNLAAQGDQKAPATPGVLTSADKPNNPDPQQQNFGPNNEKLNDLKPELVSALRQLVTQYRTEGIVARRHEIKRIRQARMFWQGLQYAAWDSERNMWLVPFMDRIGDDKDEQDMPRYMYVTNIFLAFGLSFIAVISGDVPNVRTRPESPSSIEDITAAKAAQDVINLVEENNKPKNLLTNTAFYLWTDGKIGAYVRYVADAQRFGSKSEPNFEQQDQPIGEDSYSCPQCGASSSEQDVAATGQLACPQCGAQLGQGNLSQSERVSVPMIAGSNKTPKGQEVVSIIGGLELNTPIWANEMHEFPYLQWTNEVHLAKLKATYPAVADKIQAGGQDFAEEVYARTSRLAVSQGLPSMVPGDILYNLITFARTWIRPWAFYAIENLDTRNQLLSMFPDGCYVAFAGETYCESRNESMDDYWRVMHALPGDGQNRPSVGDPIININERINTLSNIAMETYEFGIPPTYADPDVLNFDALPSTTVEPGAHYPARPRPGQSLANAFFQPAPAALPESMPAYATELAGPTAEFLTGMFPALFGGEMDTQKTATGYAQARDQAMGRIGLIWGRLKEFYAEVMMLSVKAFRDNRADDAEMAVLGDGNEYKAKWIRIADLQGNLQVVPEGDENFPRLKSQQRATLVSLLGTLGEDPEFQKQAALPENQELIKNLMGVTEWALPAEDSRHKALREIDELLKTGPQMVMQPNAMGLAAPQAQPTIPVDALFDDVEAEFAVYKAWANSEAGQVAKAENPNGFANVRAKATALQQIISQNQQGPAQKPPSESIGLKDLPPSGKSQMASQAGLQVSPDEFAQQDMQARAQKAAELQARIKLAIQG